MSLKICTSNKATDDEWESTWEACTYATYFHSREWAEVWHKYTSGNLVPNPVKITFSDGAEAILPLSYRKELKGFTKTFLSSPAGCFGGWISKDRLEIDHGILLTNLLLEYKNLFWRINPYDKIQQDMKIEKANYDETHALKLDQEFDALFKRWSKGHKSAVSKAQREGIVVKLATLEEEWKEYYSIYLDSVRRWGEKVTTLYEWKFFKEIYNLKSSNIKLWLALKNERAVAGGLSFYSKEHVVYWHGAALEEFFNLRPVNLLLYHMIRNSCEEGYAWFDFNPSNSEGVKSFKKSFGAEPLYSPVITKQAAYKTLIYQFIRPFRSKNK